ncbi:hypothetical protein NQ318_016379 [Aromia moschata]|uniref:Uncharacterized protein n=1 Tax=Aromia moschata TaxID=1265417 RepID=A0AAV8Z5Y7_9CUCU|nr:hypothetical protein NQ318_016379 [Aromia moschata]
MTTFALKEILNDLRSLNINQVKDQNKNDLRTTYDQKAISRYLKNLVTNPLKGRNRNGPRTICALKENLKGRHLPKLVLLNVELLLGTMTTFVLKEILNVLRSLNTNQVRDLSKNVRRIIYDQKAISRYLKNLVTNPLKGRNRNGPRTICALRENLKGRHLPKLVLLNVELLLGTMTIFVLKEILNVPRNLNTNQVKGLNKKRPEDNLRPEGEFEVPEKPGYQPAERPKQKRPEDNLRPEGEFERPTPTKVGPAERRTPIKHDDNLRPEGDFERPEKPGYRPAERPTPKKPDDNLRPEGTLNVPRNQDGLPLRGRNQNDQRITFTPREISKDQRLLRLAPRNVEAPSNMTTILDQRKKPEDNLRPEGEFEVPDKPGYKPAERPKQVKPQDNLKPEGEFERPEIKEIGPAEIRRPIKHDDNLRPEGTMEMVRKDDYKIVRGERVDVIKREDNLKMEGEWDIRRRDDFSNTTVVDKAEIIRRQDNLRMEGEWDMRRRDDFSKTTVVDRTQVVKHEDNLRIEGEFTDVRSRDDYTVVRGERRDVIRREDNLKVEGEFNEYKKRNEFSTRTEKTEVIRHEDNLKLEGDFERPTPTKIGPGERRRPIKHDDNLHPEGEFERPSPSKIGPGERRTPIRHLDNLRPEGDFDRPQKPGYQPTERPTPKKPQDNLHPEGEFERPSPSKIGPGERRTPIRHLDNLKPEGDFDRPQKPGYQPSERPTPKKPQDNLHPEGEFERPSPSKIGPGERRTPIRHLDNLRPEGDFDRPQKPGYQPGERPSPKKPQDNLHPEGDFETPVKPRYGPGERADIVKHPDNLKPEGQFIGTPKSKEDFKPTRGERAPIRKPQDNLKITGEFQDTTMAKSQYTVVKGERVEIKKHEDHLKVGSGKMECTTTTRETFEKTPKKSPIGPTDRTVVDKRRHMESHISLGNDVTKMETTNQTNYNTYTRKIDRKALVENKNINVINQRAVDVVDNRDVKVINKKTDVVDNKVVTNNISTDSKTLQDGTTVTTTRRTTTATSGAQNTSQVGQQVDQQVRREIVSGVNEIRKSSSQTHIHKTHQHVENVNNVVRQNNIIHSSSHTDVSSKQHVEKHGSHHKRSMVSTEEINNQILHRKGLHTSSEALHATSSSALDMRKSVCNLHDQGRTVVNTDRHSLSSMHRSNQESSTANRRSQQFTYQTVERPQKIVRKDNLSVGGHFYGQSEAKSYGEFTKQQNIQRVERVNRRSNVSNITLGDTNVHIVTSYKKEYAPRNIGPCPAVLVDAPKGPFKHTRDTKSHKFYMPVESK